MVPSSSKQEKIILLIAFLCCLKKFSQTLGLFCSTSRSTVFMNKSLICLSRLRSAKRDA